MIKNLLLEHLQERDQLASLKYIERLIPAEKERLLETNLIKIIVGPRRAGKSVCGFLLLKDKNFAYVNFDDEMLIKNYIEDELIEAIHQVYKGFQYVFFDEIQNIPNWELLVNKLYRRNYNLIITGSNARLLSKELSTALTGRYIPIDIFPFSFKEYCVLKFEKEPEVQDLTPAQRGEILSLAFDFLINGGFPECINNPSIQRTYLSTLFDSIIYKDIVKRFNIRSSNQISDLAVYLLTNFTNPYTYNSLCTDLHFNSVTSVQKYAGYLEEPFLFVSLSRFSHKLSVQKKSAKKSYIIDNGFIKARSFQFSPNYGRLLENLFCIELLRLGYKPGLDLFYYKTKNELEIDFLIRKNTKIQALIQVAFDLSEQKTLKRELNALIKAADELKVEQLFLISWDMEQNYLADHHKIRILPFWKLALGEILPLQ